MGPDDDDEDEGEEDKEEEEEQLKTEHITLINPTSICSLHRQPLQ